MKAGVEPGRGRDLARLRSVGSTGSPLSPEGFELGLRAPRRATPGCSRPRGGTDVCTAFVGGVPLLPVYRGRAPGPRRSGAAVEAFDEDGEPVIDEVGELVITEPMPSMPLFFWGDDDGSRYRASYFEHVPRDLAPRRLDRDHLARHGGHLRPLRLDHQPPGRPDGDQRDLPRRAGASRTVRRRAGGRHPAAGDRGLDAPVRRPRARASSSTTTSQAEIKRRIRDRCSPRHVPNEIFQIAEVPRTLSGKVLEVPVKRILTGTPPEQAASRDSLANPDAARLLRGVWPRSSPAAAAPRAPPRAPAPAARHPASGSPCSDRNASTTSWSNWLPDLAWSSDLARFGENRSPVGPVRGHRGVRVGHREDLPLERDLVIAQPARIAAAVGALVVGQDPLAHPAELRRADDPHADLGMALAARSARRRSADRAFRGSPLGHADLADVAQAAPRRAPARRPPREG